MTRVLIAYASRHGSTEAVARTIAALGPLSMDDADNSRNQLALALERAEVEPSVVEIFGGVIDPKKLRFPFSHMRESDARDWAAIESWADRLATLFELEQATVGV